MPTFRLLKSRWIENIPTSMEMASMITDRPDAAAAPTYAKHFIPLESNPDVFNKLIRHLGASESLQFEDVWSLDELHLEHPSVALVLVFPTIEDYEAKRDAEYRVRGVYGSDGDNENALWLKQTIQNACGLYGILHSLMNGEARGLISTNPEPPDRGSGLPADNRQTPRQPSADSSPRAPPYHPRSAPESSNPRTSSRRPTKR